MPPEDFSKRPPGGRPPYQRRPISVDGISDASIRRPAPIGREGQRPVLARRPIDNSPVLSSPTPPLSAEPLPQPSAPSIVPPVSSPLPETPEPTPLPDQTVANSPPTPMQFTPPAPKKRSRILIMVVAVIGVFLIGGGVFTGLHWQAQSNNPDTIFKAALKASLSTTKLQVTTTTTDQTTEVNYDLTNLKNPTISSHISGKLSGKAYEATGYGSAQNTYVSYTQLPSGVSGNLASVTKNAWVQLRTNGRQPSTVTPRLTNLADPRYHLFGPIVVGNFPEKTRAQLLNFMLTNKVYGYDLERVSHSKLGDTKVLVYPLRLDVGYLKVTNQSAAADEGFTPDDVQAAIDSFEAFRNADITLYVDAQTHHVVQFVADKLGRKTTFEYGQYDRATVPAEPQTKLTWQDFAPFEAQIETQAASPTSSATKP